VKHSASSLRIETIMDVVSGGRTRRRITRAGPRPPQAQSQQLIGTVEAAHENGDAIRQAQQTAKDATSSSFVDDRLCQSESRATSITVDPLVSSNCCRVVEGVSRAILMRRARSARGREP